MSIISWTEDAICDEDVFFGELTLKEIKKHILGNEHNIYYAKCASSASKEGYGNDSKIIQTHSAPDLIQRNDNEAPCTEQKNTSSVSLSSIGPDVYSDWEVKTVDDSFLKVEKMVADMCVSPKVEVKKEELNNTSDIIDYILKSPPHAVKYFEQQNESVEQSTSKKVVKTGNSTINVDNNQTDCQHSVILDNEMHCKTDNLPACFTPVKSARKQKKTEKFVTPSSDFKLKAPVFKTPANLLSAKKPSDTSLKKTPNKNTAYQHIASPVASYIKNCPVTPLVKDVRPTKPLPGPSSIPKFVKNPVFHKPSNKENMNLPSVAYKNAKKTQVIEVPDYERLPQSHLMKKITSSLPKPLVLKHNHKEMNLAKKLLTSRQEDSFNDLSLCQADVSVCTQKSAFRKPKKPL